MVVVRHTVSPLNVVDTRPLLRLAKTEKHIEIYVLAVHPIGIFTSDTDLCSRPDPRKSGIATKPISHKGGAPLEASKISAPIIKCEVVLHTVEDIAKAIGRAYVPEIPVERARRSPTALLYFGNAVHIFVHPLDTLQNGVEDLFILIKFRAARCPRKRKSTKPTVLTAKLLGLYGRIVAPEDNAIRPLVHRFELLLCRAVKRLDLFSYRIVCHIVKLGRAYELHLPFLSCGFVILGGKGIRIVLAKKHIRAGCLHIGVGVHSRKLLGRADNHEPVLIISLCHNADGVRAANDRQADNTVGVIHPNLYRSAVTLYGRKIARKADRCAEMLRKEGNGRKDLTRNGNRPHTSVFCIVSYDITVGIYVRRVDKYRLHSRERKRLKALTGCVVVEFILPCPL